MTVVSIETNFHRTYTVEYTENDGSSRVIENVTYIKTGTFNGIKKIETKDGSTVLVSKNKIIISKLNKKDK